jgi:hypothetical protein
MACQGGPRLSACADTSIGINPWLSGRTRTSTMLPPPDFGSGAYDGCREGHLRRVTMRCTVTTRPCLSRVKSGKPPTVHMFSALPPEADIRQTGRDVRVVPLSDSCTAAYSSPIGSVHRRGATRRNPLYRMLHIGVGNRAFPVATSSGQTTTCLPSCHWIVTALWAV